MSLKKTTYDCNWGRMKDREARRDEGRQAKLTVNSFQFREI